MYIPQRVPGTKYEKKSNLTGLLIDFLKSHYFRFLSDGILPCSQYASLNLFARKLTSSAFSNHTFVINGYVLNATQKCL